MPSPSGVVALPADWTLPAGFVNTRDCRMTHHRHRRPLLIPLDEVQRVAREFAQGYRYTLFFWRMGDRTQRVMSWDGRKPRPTVPALN